MAIIDRSESIADSARQGAAGHDAALVLHIRPPAVMMLAVPAT